MKNPESSIANHVHLINARATRCCVDGKLVVASFGQNPETGKNLKPKVSHFKIGETENMIREIEVLSREKHRNVYTPMALMRGDLEANKKGGEKDIKYVLGFVVDDDTGACYPDGLPLSPDYVLETSPGRYQAFYFFDEPLKPSEAKEIANKLCEFTGCDNGTKDLSHVWRVPDCPNWPNQKKADAGRALEPFTVRVIKDFDGSL